MSQVELIRVHCEGAEKIIWFSADALNNMTTARQIALQLGEIVANEPTGGDQATACDDVSRLNLDFKDVDWLNTDGLNELIGINNQARGRGVRLVLLDVQESVRDIFAVTRLERMFEFSTSQVTA